MKNYSNQPTRTELQIYGTMLATSNSIQKQVSLIQTTNRENWWINSNNKINFDYIAQLSRHQLKISPEVRSQLLENIEKTRWIETQKWPSFSKFSSLITTTWRQDKLQNWSKCQLNLQKFSNFQSCKKKKTIQHKTEIKEIPRKEQTTINCKKLSTTAKKKNYQKQKPTNFTQQKHHKSAKFYSKFQNESHTK